MKTYRSTLLFLLFIFFFLRQALAQTGYRCSDDLFLYPCRPYAFYRESLPDLLSLASVADLFNVSPLIISPASDIPSPALTSPLIPNQSLLIPITCSCGTSNHSYANVTYQFKRGDTFYLVSTNLYQNLTAYGAVQFLNPSLVPTNLTIGVDVIFPIFCQCPDRKLLRNRVNYLITYTFQPFDDTLSSVATRFGSSVDVDLLTSVNGGEGRVIPPF